MSDAVRKNSWPTDRTPILPPLEEAPTLDCPSRHLVDGLRVPCDLRIGHNDLHQHGDVRWQDGD